MTKIKFKIILVTIFSLSFPLTIAASSATPQSFAPIIEPLMPAVVNIYTTRYLNNKMGYRPVPPGSPFEYFNDIFENFNNPYFQFDESYSNPGAVALGSGFIIDKEGYIVTNHHVVENADEISVKLHDDTELKAKLIGSDRVTDLALLKVAPKKPLQAVKFGDSDSARIGDWIIAIGNPFGLGGTVTTGIISSKGRDLNTESGMIDDYLQTDAAINSGNSGGPMFNLEGDVIGINTALISPSGTNIGIGFAIPSSTANGIISKLKKQGKITRGMLGIRIQGITEAIAEGLGLDESGKGVLVVEVTPDSAAEKGGLQEGDIITAVNQHEVSSSRKLRILISEMDINKPLTLTIIRAGKMQNIQCKLQTVDDEEYTDSAKPSISSKGEIEINGVTFATLYQSESAKDALQTNSAIIITKIDPKSKWRTLRKGDVISAINQDPVKNIKEFKAAYEKAAKQNKKNIVFLVKRQNATLFIALPIYPAAK